VAGEAEVVLPAARLGYPTEGYRDQFIVSLVRGMVASEHGPRFGIALLTGLLSLLLLEVAKPGGRLRGIATPLPPAPACWQPDSSRAVRR
jgi:hypothetical protein